MQSAGLVGPAWCGIPTRTVRNLLKMLMHDERFAEVLRICYHRRYHQPGVATIGVRKAIDVFFQRRVATVRNAVLTQISGTHMRRDHLKITSSSLPLFPQFYGGASCIQPALGYGSTTGGTLLKEFVSF